MYRALLSTIMHESHRLVDEFYFLKFRVRQKFCVRHNKWLGAH